MTSQTKMEKAIPLLTFISLVLALAVAIYAVKQGRAFDAAWCGGIAGFDLMSLLSQQMLNETHQMTDEILEGWARTLKSMKELIRVVEESPDMKGKHAH